MSWSISAIEVIFILTLSLTFFAAFLGRKHAKIDSKGLASESLNKWLVGLSAGATANSGFIVTGAVGLGYSFGPQWLFLPISWFLGDLLFWKLFPHRINQFGKKASVTTLSELLTKELTGNLKSILTFLIVLLILIFLGGYTSAQWIAGQKFVSGAFEISSVESLALFAILIVSYSSIGGFRGSIYADTVQAIIRLIGTVLALGLVFWVVYSQPETFKQNITLAGSSFLQILPSNSIFAVVFFVLGYVFASIGFGLGQPQLIARYLAGSSPEETQAAKWIYISFVQFTWISMTLFGVLLRGIMPEINDPEAGLSLFFATYAGSIITGVIVADIFSTIAATSNSLLVAMAQTLVYDLVPNNRLNKLSKESQMTLSVLLLGFLTMFVAFWLTDKSTVFELALGSVSLLGASLAAPVMIKLLNLKHTDFSFLISIISGLFFAVLWKCLGFSQLFNETAIGIAAGLIANGIIVNKIKLKEVLKK